jgi:hypothetical protein
MESVKREEECREYPCENCSCLEEFRPYSEIIANTQFLRHSLLNRNVERDAIINFENEANIRGDGKPLTSSFNICPEACCGKGCFVGTGRVTPSLLITTLFPSLFIDISFEDDVTVILLLLGVFLIWIYREL